MIKVELKSRTELFLLPGNDDEVEVHSADPLPNNKPRQRHEVVFKTQSWLIHRITNCNLHVVVTRMWFCEVANHTFLKRWPRVGALRICSYTLNADTHTYTHTHTMAGIWPVNAPADTGTFMHRPHIFDKLAGDKRPPNTNIMSWEKKEILSHISCWTTKTER